MSLKALVFDLNGSIKDTEEILSHFNQTLVKIHCMYQITKS